MRRDFKPDNDVHRATVARWLAELREHLLAATRAHLAESLQLKEDELDSLIRLLRTELSLSLSPLGR